jgi:hypothetical protein
MMTRRGVLGLLALPLRGQTVVRLRMARKDADVYAPRFQG